MNQLEQGGAVPQNVRQDPVLVWWTGMGPHSAWLPKLDLLAMSLLPESDLLRVRWLRLAARNLSRELRAVRFLPMKEDEAARFEAAVEQVVAEGTIPIQVELCLLGPNQERRFSFIPQAK
jgi:hypothetical protein